MNKSLKTLLTVVLILLLGFSLYLISKRESSSDKSISKAGLLNSAKTAGAELPSKPFELYKYAINRQQDSDYMAVYRWSDKTGNSKADVRNMRVVVKKKGSWQKIETYTEQEVLLRSIIYNDQGLWACFYQHSLEHPVCYRIAKPGELDLEKYPIIDFLKLWSDKGVVDVNSELVDRSVSGDKRKCFAFNYKFVSDALSAKHFELIPGFVSRPDVNDAVKQLSNVQHEYKSCFDINSGVLIEENIITSYGDKIQKSTKKLMDLYMNPDFSAILKTKAVAKSEKENATGYYSDFAVAGDKLFVAAENGLVDIQNEQVTVNADHGQVETVCEFKGDIYAGTRRPGKILRYNGINWAVEKNNLFMVTAIKAVSDTLYAISFKGVFKRQNGQWLKLQRLSKISVRDIFSHKGKLYAMTLTDGLYEITDDDPVQVFTIKQTGYHSELIVETGQVYIKAKSGLLKWTDDGLKRLSDIKVHGEVLTFKEHNGKLFIATTRGIIEHGNSRITDDELVGQIKIFKVFNGQLYAGGTQGVYKLVDNDWQPVGNQMAVGQVDTLTVFKGQLYAGGLYSIAKLQGADWLSKVLYNVNKFIILKDQLYAVAEEQGSIHKVWIESDPAMAKKEFELPEDAEVKNND